MYTYEVYMRAAREAWHVCEYGAYATGEYDTYASMARVWQVCQCGKSMAGMPHRSSSASFIHLPA